MDVTKYGSLLWVGLLWMPVTGAAQTRIDLRNQGRSPDLSAMGPTKTIQSGTQLPASCSVGQVYFKTDAPATANLYTCASPNTWGILGGLPNYSTSFSAQKTVLVGGATHGLGTSNVVVECYDNGTPARKIEADTITVDPDSLDVQIVFASPQDGRCVINGSGGAAGGGGVSAIGNLESGVGLSMTQAGGVTSLAVDTAVIPTFLGNSQLLSIGPFLSGGCAEAVLPINGAAVGDAVASGWPAQLASGLIGTMWVSAANQVSIRLCNISNTPVDALNDFFRATIMRSF
jgi:hypothetical protein